MHVEHLKIAIGDGSICCGIGCLLEDLCVGFGDLGGDVVGKVMMLMDSSIFGSSLRGSERISMVGWLT